MSQDWGVGDEHSAHSPSIRLDDHWHRDMMLLAEARGLTLLLRARDPYGDARYDIDELADLTAEVDDVILHTTNVRLRRFGEDLRGVIESARQHGIPLFVFGD